MNEILLLAALSLNAGISLAQNTFPSSGNVGIKTPTQDYSQDVKSTFSANSLYLAKQLLLSQVASTHERGIFNFTAIQVAL